MKQFTTEELKIAWRKLWNSDADGLWATINTELARRLSRNEYAEFVAQF